MNPLFSICLNLVSEVIIPTALHGTQYSAGAIVGVSHLKNPVKL